ncbi:MAG: hypothetical protein H6964_09810 [Chromatiaceae bacterium]|nr:hypothetical protein [Gammaproteobacteria bacterium]MCB1881904.1 hypothetical protein [Gammaproteobacteria bacterium]MCP5427944.1 hypothetical protein [Chromatiaceae bacterium]MCP5447280.1 hypothetical protein [Chromatiaceae bacterium]
MTLNEWEKENSKLKSMWVVSIMLFWFSVSFQTVLYIVDNRLNLILTSVIGGMLVIGIALKIKLQRHLAKKAGAK